MYFIGLDVDLAKAIDQGFYDFYKNWTKVNGSRASSKEKVNSLISKQKWVLVKIQADQWVESWQQHLVDRATPKDLVDIIVTKRKRKAKKLKDEIVKNFNVENNPSSSWKVFYIYYQVCLWCQICNFIEFWVWQ